MIGRIAASSGISKREAAAFLRELSESVSVGLARDAPFAEVGAKLVLHLPDDEIARRSASNDVIHLHSPFGSLPPSMGADQLSTDCVLFDGNEDLDNVAVALALIGITLSAAVNIAPAICDARTIAFRIPTGQFCASILPSLRW